MGTDTIIKELESKDPRKTFVMLSILIPTIPSRNAMFRALTKELERQNDFIKEYHWTLGCVEIIWDRSKPFLDGGPSIGEKRQKLVRRAQGKYLCFLDDDEDIAPNYLETLLRLCNEDMDVCAFRNLSRFDNYWAVFDLSIKNPSNEQSRSDQMVMRRPWHICPVRSEFAKMVDFPNSNYGEDWEWFEKVLVYCRTEAKTNAIIHCYNGYNSTSEATKIVNHAQGGS